VASPERPDPMLLALWVWLSNIAFRRRSTSAVTPDRGVGICPYRCMRAAGSRMVLTHLGGVVFAGIDSQKDTLAMALVDKVGLPVAVVQEPNTRSGFVRIGELLAKHQVTRVGIEGSGHYGRCMAAYLALDWDQSGVGVLEVPTLMTSRERGARPGRARRNRLTRSRSPGSRQAQVCGARSRAGFCRLKPVHSETRSAGKSGRRSHR